MKGEVVSCDFETRSTVELSSAGAHAYSIHPTTDIWCLAFQFNDEDPQLIQPGDEFPDRLRKHIEDGGEMRAWNAQFERLIWKGTCVPKYGWPVVADDQWYCTAADAAAMALPRSLDKCAVVLKAKNKKDGDGHNLMMRMARPRKINDDGSLVWWDDDERKAKLFAYCLQDVRVEAEIKGYTHRLPKSEREVYRLDQVMNDRGVRIDIPLVYAMKNLVARIAEAAEVELGELTGGAVPKVTSLPSMKKWLIEQGVEITKLDKGAVVELLASPHIVGPVARVLRIRNEVGKSSVAKLSAILDALSPDGTVKGMLLYHAATTGRWAGQGVQPHNFARPTVKKPERYLDLVMEENLDALELFANPMDILMSLLRGTFMASEGHELRWADYAGIEARVTAWVSDQEDLLQLFRDGADIYVDFANSIEGGTRPLGKVGILGCGFGMGHITLQRQAKDQYGLDLTLKQTKAIVDAYRARFHRVKKTWYELQEACENAVRYPGRKFFAGHSTFIKAGGYLYIKLPSGRLLAYAGPKIEGRYKWWDYEEVEVNGILRRRLRDGAEKQDTVIAYAVDNKTRQWSEFEFYGGLLMENIVQATARDIMAEAMLRLDAAGYNVVLSVHDEVINDTPKEHGSMEEMIALMEQVPTWCPGMPIKVEAERGDRWRK